MNSDERGKITQNLTYLKDRLVELDPVIDRLIEKRVFRLEHRGQIEGISKPTPHRQFNEFIKLLVSSPCKETFQVFVEALKEEGYGFIAQKLQKTPPKESYRRSESAVTTRTITSRNEQYPSMLDADDVSGASGVADPARTTTTTTNNNNCSDCAGTVKAMLETFGKQQQEILLTLERQRREDIHELERRRIQDNTVNQENMRELWNQWQTEKQDLTHNNEMKIENLQTLINDFQRGSAEFNVLKERYDHLKEQQKGLKEKDDERKKRLQNISQESEELQKEKRKLEKELRHVKQDLCESEETNRSLEDDNRNSDENITQLENKIHELEEELKIKDKRNKDLKSELDKQHTDMQNLLRHQREATKIDDPEFVHTVEQQNKKLDAIYGMMQNISTDKGKRLKTKYSILAGKKNTPRNNNTTAVRESLTDNMQ